MTSVIIQPSAEFFDGIGIKYEEAFAHDIGLQNFIGKALSVLPPKAKVLDIGCGTGKPTSSMIAANGHNLHGIDLSPVMVELSRKNVPLGAFEVADMLHFNPKEKFDAAFMNFSMFDVTRDQMSTVASKWREWISENGFLFIGTMVAEDFRTKPDMFDADGMCVHGVAKQFMGKTIANSYYTKEGWKQLLLEGGFEIVETEADLFQPPAEAMCDDEPHYFITARKVSST
jgi:cyclopropane fatty-acyl-phospholipid synthase-like methyltransferase